MERLIGYAIGGFIILIITGALWFLYHVLYQKNGDDDYYKKSMIFRFVFGCALIFTFMMVSSEAIPVLKTHSYSKYINNGFSIYIDGTKVDSDNINIADYKVYVDEKNKKLLLTRD